MEDHRRLYHWLKDANLRYTLDESQHLKKHYVSTMASGIRGDIHGVLLELHTDFPLTYNLHHYSQLIAADIEERSAIQLVLKYYYSNEKDRLCLIIVPHTTDHGSRRYRGKRYQLKDASGQEETALKGKYVNHARREQRKNRTETFNSTKSIETQITEDEIQQFHKDLKVIDLDNYEITSDSGISETLDTDVTSHQEIVDVNVVPVQQNGTTRHQGELEVTPFNGNVFQNPILRTSKATTTEDSSIVVTPGTNEPKPFIYEEATIHRSMLKTYMSKNENFERVRQQVAYFIKEKNVAVNHMSYVCNKIFLANNGLNLTDSELYELYIEFCCEKGLDRKLVEADLNNCENAIRTRRLNYLTQARKSFYEYYNSSANSGQSRFQITSPYPASPGRCDPELCALM